MCLKKVVRHRPCGHEEIEITSCQNSPTQAGFFQRILKTLFFRKDVRDEHTTIETRVVNSYCMSCRGQSLEIIFPMGLEKYRPSLVPTFASQSGGTRTQRTVDRPSLEAVPVESEHLQRSDKASRVYEKLLGHSEKRLPPNPNEKQHPWRDLESHVGKELARSRNLHDKLQSYKQGKQQQPSGQDLEHPRFDSLLGDDTLVGLMAETVLEENAHKVEEKSNSVSASSLYSLPEDSRASNASIPTTYMYTEDETDTTLSDDYRPFSTYQKGSKHLLPKPLNICKTPDIETELAPQSHPIMRGMRSESVLQEFVGNDAMAESSSIYNMRRDERTGARNMNSILGAAGYREHSTFSYQSYAPQQTNKESDDTTLYHDETWSTTTESVDIPEYDDTWTK